MKVGKYIDFLEKNRFCNINLVASENIMSEYAKRALSCDLAHRYIIPPKDKRPESIWEYPYQNVNRLISQNVENLSKKMFHGEYADVRPLSGNNAVYIIIKSQVPRDGCLFSIPADCGGHFATDEICKRELINRIDIPFDQKKASVDIDHLLQLYQKYKPDLILFDSSMVLFPFPIKEIRERLGINALISYDASQTFGLIAGGYFQQPLLEGADIIHGSVHKTLFGPQKGIIVCKSSIKSEYVQKINTIITPLFVSNAHMHHIAALGASLEEIELYGSKYASRTIQNAVFFAESLEKVGFNVFQLNSKYTQSHQVWCMIGNQKESLDNMFRLENIGINLNIIKVPFTNFYGFRIGVAEVTRRGFQKRDILKLSEIMYECISGSTSMLILKNMVSDISSKYRSIKYCITK